MKIFIENFDPDDRLILCPFTGISTGWNISIAKDNTAAVCPDEQIIPFKISVLTTKES